jgi:hypothetical protein
LTDNAIIHHNITPIEPQFDPIVIALTMLSFMTQGEDPMPKTFLLIMTGAMTLFTSAAFAGPSDFTVLAERIETTMLLLIPLVALMAFAYMLRLASVR